MCIKHKQLSNTPWMDTDRFSDILNTQFSSFVPERNVSYSIFFRAKQLSRMQTVFKLFCAFYIVRRNRYIKRNWALKTNRTEIDRCRRKQIVFKTVGIPVLKESARKGQVETNPFFFCFRLSGRIRPSRSQTPYGFREFRNSISVIGRRARDVWRVLRKGPEKTNVPANGERSARRRDTKTNRTNKTARAHSAAAVAAYFTRDKNPIRRLAPVRRDRGGGGGWTGRGFGDEDDAILFV